MDNFVRRTIRAAQTGDTEAWNRIELALRQQYLEIVDLPVWIVRYSHGHGTDINVFLTSDTAYQGIISILDHWWDEEMEEIERPSNIIDAIELFNDHNYRHGEYIDIEESRIRG